MATQDTSQDTDELTGDTSNEPDIVKAKMPRSPAQIEALSKARDKAISMRKLKAQNNVQHVDDDTLSNPESDVADEPVKTVSKPKIKQVKPVIQPASQPIIKPAIKPAKRVMKKPEIEVEPEVRSLLNKRRISPMSEAEDFSCMTKWNKKCFIM